MNSLSWLIYIADVLPTAAGVAITFAIFAMIYFIIFAPPKGVEIFGRGHNAPLTGIADNVGKIATCCVIIVLSVLIPSKETFYLIAASEAGHSVVESEQGQKILDDITTIINNELDKMKGE